MAGPIVDSAPATASLAVKFLLILGLTASNSGPVWVGRFAGSGDPPSPWRVIRYNQTKPTIYHQAKIHGIPAIEARVDHSMSLLARPIAVELSATPVLCWRWLVDAAVAKADMRHKSGDDYAARIYIMFDMPDSALDGGTKMKLAIARKMFRRDLPDAAVTYVWDNRQTVGTIRRSPFTDRSQLVVAQSGDAHSGKWVTERVNVASDFARAFRGKPGTPTRLAIAADGDNTKSRGRAAFADIHFVPRGANCEFPNRG